MGRGAARIVTKCLRRLRLGHVVGLGVAEGGVRQDEQGPGAQALEDGPHRLTEIVSHALPPLPTRR